MMKHILLLALLLPLAATLAVGQTLQITGRVLDDSTSNGLPNVSVTVVETKKGTSTDNDGNFKVTVTGRRTISLLFSYIGYTSQTVSTNGASPVTVTLHKGIASAGDEVIVIGYGAVRKKDLTGAVTSLKGDELKEIPTANVVEA